MSLPHVQPTMKIDNFNQGKIRCSKNKQNTTIKTKSNRPMLNWVAKKYK